MNFNSLEFLIFFPVVYAVHWILPHRFRWIWLLTASCFFYMSWNPRLIVLLFLTVFISYLAAIGLERMQNVKRRKGCFAAAVFFCLGTLICFKYLNFFLENLLFLLRLIWKGIPDVQVNLVLPVGISFYTFQTLSYVIDVKRGTIRAEQHLGYYALYISFFPQLVAGPIERPGNLLVQLRAKRTWCRKDLEEGMRWMLSGFFRKIAVADVLGIYVNRVFSDLEHANALAIVLAGALFCIQMYCDFAGYSEIAVGAARMLGIRLMRNFNRPYLSASYAEFFRRWHISLSQWFADYLYIPLGGNRKGTGRKIVNTFVIFLLCGLWHGARWTYVLWGAYAAFWISLESLFLKKKNWRGWKLWARRGVMWLLFIPAALLFRAEGGGQLLLIGRQLLVGSMNLHRTIQVMGIGVTDACLCLLVVVGMILIGSLTEPEDGRKLSEDTVSYCNRVTVYGLLVLVILFSALYLASGKENAAFAYFQF